MDPSSGNHSTYSTLLCGHQLAGRDMTLRLIPFNSYASPHGLTGNMALTRRKHDCMDATM